MSMNSRVRGSRSIPEASSPAVMSPPTYAPNGGNTTARARGCTAHAQVGGEHLGQQPGGHDERRHARAAPGRCRARGGSWWRCRPARPRRPRPGPPRPAAQTSAASSARVCWASAVSRASASGSIMVALIRVITSAPNGCCWFSTEATATGVPVDRSSRVATTVVVPRSNAMPNSRAEVSPGLHVDQHVVDDHRGDLVVRGAQHPAEPPAARAGPPAVPGRPRASSIRSMSVRWSARVGSASSR